VAEKYEIEFTIADDGKVSFEVKGLKGKRCLEVTKEIEQALGIVVNREHTSEYYQQDVQLGGYLQQQGG
jgi:hypothetical protein